MLQRLKIQGFTLLDDVTFELTSGLNVLSGETGAGKSLVLTALGLLLGARTPASCVREGHDSALVEAHACSGMTLCRCPSWPKRVARCCASRFNTHRLRSAAPPCSSAGWT